MAPPIYALRPKIEPINAPQQALHTTLHTVTVSPCPWGCRYNHQHLLLPVIGPGSTRVQHPRKRESKEPSPDPQLIPSVYPVCATIPVRRQSEQKRERYGIEPYLSLILAESPSLRLSALSFPVRSTLRADPQHWPSAPDTPTVYSESESVHPSADVPAPPREFSGFRDR